MTVDCALIHDALVCVEEASGLLQQALTARTAATIGTNPGPIGVGRMLALQRRIERLELIGRELHGLLDQPPASTEPRQAA